MGFLKNVVKKAVDDGISKGIKEAVSGAVEKAVNPVAEKWANQAAEDLDKAAGTTAETVKETNNAFENLQKAAENYSASVKAAEAKALKATFSFPAPTDADKDDADRFIGLVGKYNGFEAVLGFRDWEDHHIGGKGNFVWYCVTNGKKIECYIAELNGNTWDDKFYSAKGAAVSCTDAASGITVAMIADRLFTGQSKIRADGRKGVSVEGVSEKCTRYNFNFGAVAYDVSDEYGVTIRLSDCDNAERGFSLRCINTGSDVEKPEF